MAVRDGDNVGRNVGRHVICLRFDNRQTGHRATAQIIGQLRAAFQQARVQVEHVTRVGFTPRRTAQQQRHRAVGFGLLGQVIKHNQHVLALVHPVLTDGRTGVGSQVLEPGRIRSRGGHDGGELHRTGVFQRALYRGNRGALLSDRHVDAAHLLVGVTGLPVVALVQNRVNGDSGLAGLTVTNNQLTLAATNRNHRVDGFQPGLERLEHGTAHHHAGSLQFQSTTLAQVLDFAQAVNRVAQRVNHAAQVTITHRHGEHVTRAVDLLTFLNPREITQDDSANLTLVQVHCQTQGTVLEAQQLVGHSAGQALDVGNAVSSFGHVADFLRSRGGWFVRIHKLVQGALNVLGTY